MNHKICLAVIGIFLVGVVSANVTLEKGVNLDPDGTSSNYYIQNEINFTNVDVYNDKVNLSGVNVTTSSVSAVNVSISDFNFSVEGENAVFFSYNETAETSFYPVDPSYSFEVIKDGNTERTVYGQEWVNVSMEQGEQLEIKRFMNTPPDEPVNPVPQDTAEGVSTSPNLEIDVSDPDNDLMNVSFYDGSDNLIGFNEEVSDGTTSLEWTGLNPGSEYTWYARSDDGITGTDSSEFSFTTNYEPDIINGGQFYENFTVDHQFEVTAYAEDQDGFSDFESCTVNYQDQEGNSGTLTGSLDDDSDDYGTENQSSCTATVSNSLQGIEVGEKVTTSVEFDDGLSTVETSDDSNTVPNSPPVAPTSYTDLGRFVDEENPLVQWNGQDEPDNDYLNMTAYVGQSQDPGQLDNYVDASIGEMHLGQNIDLQSNETYYYELEACDEFGLCNSTESVEFKMNDVPNITQHQLNNSAPTINDTVEIQAEVDDRNLQSVNFTVWEGDMKIIDNQNGTFESGVWRSPEFETDIEEYNYSIKAEDNKSATGEANASFSSGFKESGIYRNTYSTADPVRSVKITYYGELNGGSVDLMANTSGSDSLDLENNTWRDISPGQDITAGFELEGDGASTPEISGYSLDYGTNYKNEGYALSRVEDLGSTVEVKEVAISQQKTESTDTTYEFRSGSDGSPPDQWSDWTQCSSTCDPGTPENRYFQYRVNLSTTTDSDTPVLDRIEVRYE